MKRLFKLLAGTAGVLSLSVTGHSMEFFDESDHVAKVKACPTKTPVFFRQNAHGNLQHYFAARQLHHRQKLKESPTLSFPEQKEQILEVIQQGYTKLKIHIPRNADGYTNVQPIDFSLGGFHHMNVTSIVIEHSTGDSRGYWPAAVRALTANLKYFPNLVEITLSDVIVPDLIKSLEYGTTIRVDCKCYYTTNDTIYPLELLKARAESIVSDLQHNHKHFPFYATEIQNPFLHTPSNQENNGVVKTE